MSEQLVIWRFNVISTFEAHYQSNTCDSLATVRGKLKIVDGLAFVAFERPPLKSGYTVLPESHNAHVWRQVGCGWIKLCNIVHLCSWFVPDSFLAPFDMSWSDCQEWIDATHLELSSKDARNYEELMRRAQEAEARAINDPRIQTSPVWFLFVPQLLNCVNCVSVCVTCS